MFACVGEPLVANADLVVLADFVLVQDAADRHADLVTAVQIAFLALGSLTDTLQLQLGRFQQRLALAFALGGQNRIVTNDQSLAWVVIRANLGQTPIVEQRRLEGSLDDELGDLWLR